MHRLYQIFRESMPPDPHSTTVHPHLYSDVYHSLSRKLGSINIACVLNELSESPDSDYCSQDSDFCKLVWKKIRKLRLFKKVRAFCEEKVLRYLLLFIHDILAQRNR